MKSITEDVFKQPQAQVDSVADYQSGWLYGVSLNHYKQFVKDGQFDAEAALAGGYSEGQLPVIEEALKFTGDISERTTKELQPIDEQDDSSNQE